MSCVHLSDDQHLTLRLVAHREPVPEDLAQVMEELRQWGWVMRSGELTGIGWAHLENGTSGRVGIHDRP